jgi:hypothetical protein
VPFGWNFGRIRLPFIEDPPLLADTAAVRWARSAFFLKVAVSERVSPHFPPAKEGMQQGAYLGKAADEGKGVGHSSIRRREIPFGYKGSAMD